jgi:hypothetical protein
MPVGKVEPSMNLTFLWSSHCDFAEFGSAGGDEVNFAITLIESRKHAAQDACLTHALASLWAVIPPTSTGVESVTFESLFRLVFCGHFDLLSSSVIATRFIYTPINLLVKTFLRYCMLYSV